MLKNLFYKITGDPNDKEIKALQPLAAKINELEPSFKKLSDIDRTNKGESVGAFVGDTLDL